MKKTFFPFSFLSLFTILISTLIAGASLYILIKSIYMLVVLMEYILIIPIACCLLGVIIGVGAVVSILANKIIFTDEKIIATGGKGSIQHKEVIDYLEIKDISLIFAHIDSKGKTLKTFGYASMRPHLFFEFCLQNGLSKLIHIEIYSIKQRKKMLEIINKKTNLNFAYSKLERKDKSIFKKRK